MLKRDGFQPTDPALFNAALASASATLSQQARSSASCSTFMRAKRRDFLLAHTTIPVHESQRRSRTVSPGSETLLFDEEMLGVVVTQVQQSSLISSNLAMSRSLARGQGRSSSSPVVDPSPAGSSRAGRPHFKRSSSSSRSRGRKRFKGGKRSAPSPVPSGFRKWEPSPCLTLSGGCLSLHWQAWRDRGAEPWVVEVLRYGYRIPFLCDPPLSRAPISLPSYHPSSIKGVALRDCSQALVAKSAVELAPLPSLGFYSRLFVVWKTGYRSLDPQLVRGRSSLPHGDHPVCTAVSSSGRLDGLHRPQGSLPADPCPSGLSSLPSVCCSGPGLRVLCPLLWPVHSPSGLLSGHGSCFRHSPLLGYSHEAVPRRLARPVLVSGSSPSRSPGGSRSLPGARDCGQPFQVSPSSISGSPIPGCRDRLPGFSVFGARHQAVLNSRRVSLLRRSSRQYLAAASRHSVVSRPSRSWRPPEGPISATVSPPAVGSGGYVCSDLVVSALPQGSSVVARPSSSVSRGVSRPGLPRSGLLVRRLGRGLGCSPRLSHCFRPLGSGAGSAFHQRARAPSCEGGSPPLSALSPGDGCVGLLRQQHCGVLSAQGGGNQISVFKHSSSGDPALDGVSLHPAPTPVHSGVTERPRGLPLSSSPTSLIPNGPFTRRFFNL